MKKRGIRRKRKGPVTWVPHKYQQDAVRHLLANGAAGLWLDPGLGKTMCALFAFAALKKAGTAKRMLVISTLRVCQSVWAAEAAKWEQTKHLKVVFIHGTDKASIFSSAMKDADVVCVNFEGLGWILDHGRLGSLGVDVLCIDEVSKMKNTASMRFKFLKPHLGKFTRRWTLTGTPAPNGLLDIFGQIYILDTGKCLGTFITAYREKFFEKTGDGYDWILREGAEEEIYDAIAPLILRVDDSVLDLPKLVFNDIYVDLPAAAMKQYLDMERNLTVKLSDGTRVTAVSAGVAAGKCIQMANGGIYVTDEETGIRTSRQVHTAKIDALAELLDEIQHKPTLLLYQFEHDLERIREAFPHAEVVADYSAKKADRLFERWNNGSVTLLAAQPQSIGHGLNLQGGGQHVVWLGCPWDLEIWIQAIRRLWRQGSEFSHIFVHCILARNTIDTTVREVVNLKDADQSALLRAVKARYVKPGTVVKVDFGAGGKTKKVKKRKEETTVGRAEVASVGRSRAVGRARFVRPA